MATVAILGGGVAGLSAAHELAERGFHVRVYEVRDIWGGKARSVDVPGTETPSRKPLPGEHGFRFFPGFYRHITDTLSRIPYGNNDNGVLDNLVATSEMLLARADKAEITLPSEPPDRLSEVRALLGALVGGDVGIPWFEIVDFAARMTVFLTSCSERRNNEYDRISWWDFIDAESKSEAFKRFLGQGATRSLVAMRAETSSTRTIATIYNQMLAHLISPLSDVDQLMTGPTNDVWIDPWIEYLDQLGVELHEEHRAVEIKSDRTRCTGVVVETPDGTQTEIDADFYIAALPVEVMIDLSNDELEEAAPQLKELPNLHTEWMNGIQFYLDRDVKIVHGHGLFLDSEWALTSISQAQFWDHPLTEYGDGKVDGILSICVSDWDSPGILFGKPAKECTKDEIRQEVWAQLKAHLNDDAVHELDDANVLHWFLDDSITFPNPSQAANLEPLLVNTMGTWARRPDADLGMGNFFLASDYVKTETDLATMEAANEAARRAVNAILEESNSWRPRCELWKLKEWSVLAPLRALDQVRYSMGRPHVASFIWD